MFRKTSLPVGLTGLPLLGHPDDLETLVGLLEQVLVRDGGDEPRQLCVARELRDVLDQPLDDLAVALPEGGHEAGHLPVVLRVDVGPGAVQQLHHVEVTAVSCQPEGGVALLVPHVHLVVIVVMMVMKVTKKVMIDKS